MVQGSQSIANNRWPKFICFVGIDGSGKTTLAKRLVRSAKENGINCHYVWANSQPILIAPLRKLWRLIFFQEKNMFDDYDDYNKTKKQVARKSKILYALYRFAHTFDYFLWVMLRVQLPLLFGRNIVCDRYTYDVSVNISTLLDYNLQDTISLINTYLKYFPKPDILFLVDVPETVALGRKNDVPSFEYLEERRRIYLSLKERYQMISLDGTDNIGRLIGKIFDEISTKTVRG